MMKKWPSFKSANKSICFKIETLLDKKLENQPLILNEDAFLAVHLTSCLPCRIYEKENRQIQETLESMDEAPPPEALVDKIMTSVAQQKVSRPRKILPKAMVAAVLGTLISVSLFSYMGSNSFLQQKALNANIAQVVQSPGVSAETPATSDTLISMEESDGQIPDSPLSSLVGF
jgi:hypothetical protein